MGNSFGSYSEPGTRNSYQAEASPMVRDDDDVAPELRRRWGDGVVSHMMNISSAQKLNGKVNVISTIK